MRDRVGSRQWVLTVLLAVILIAAGCTDSTSSSERSEETGDPAIANGGEPGEDSPTTVDGAQTAGPEARTDQGTFRVGLTGAVAVDPALASLADVSQVVAVGLLYHRLTTVGEDGEVLPGLARFSPNDELDVWTFELDTTATFADGATITAADVVYSLNRVVGLGPGWLAAAGLENIETMSATGTTTVDIHLHRPSAVLPEILSAPSYGIVQRVTMEAIAAGEPVLPNASGDYAVREIVDNRIVLGRRGGAGPTQVELVTFLTESEALDAFLAGDVDWTISPADRLEEAIAAAGADGIVPFHGALYLAIDARVSPLGRRGARTAIALAIDRDALVDEVYGPVAQPMLGVLPSGVPGASVDDCRDPCGPDRARAESLFNDALADGQDRRLRILVPRSTGPDVEGANDLEGSGTMERVGRVLAEQLRAAGIDAEVTPEDLETYHQLITSGRQQLYVYSWLGMARSPADYLPPLFDTDSPDNLTGYSNANVDEAMIVANTQVAHEPRIRAWQEAERLVLQSVAVVPLVQFLITSVTHTRIDGLVVEVDGTLDLGRVTFPA